MRRRGFMAGTLALLTAPARRLAANAPGDLLEAARQLAATPYEPASAPLPPPFDNLDYDSYRGIRPITGKTAMLPHGDAFAIDLLPPGLYFPDPVRIDIERDGAPREISFAPSLFDFDDRYFSDVPDTAPGAGFSGLRLRHPVNAAGRMDEVLVVQGASYFRAIGEAMVYGLSARAVAIGTGGTGPEEFPRFTHLRIHAPAHGTVRLEGLIDSPSLAGHIDITVRPGRDTETDITLTLLPRVEIADIGIAPLTSMYLKGPLRSAVSDDFRPRVHDSDLLFIENGAGEHLWRPITNPAGVETSAFLDESPARFGLYQTARAFEDFQDTEARYHDRPNGVVQPTGDWGRGAVTLVEIPTGDEFMDNIVAFWRPDTPLKSGSEHRYRYRLTWTRRPPVAEGPARILQSRSGREHHLPGTRRYVVDVAGDATGLQPELSATGDAETSGLAVFALPEGRGTRVTFLLTPGAAEAVELRLSIPDATNRSTRTTWLHRWTRARDGGV